MIVAGIAEVIIGLQARSWSGYFLWIMLGILFGILHGVVGALTLPLGTSLLAKGVLRIFLAFPQPAHRDAAAQLRAFAAGIADLAQGSPCNTG